MPRPSRSLALDIAVVAAIVLLLGGLVGAYVAFGRGGSAPRVVTSDPAGQGSVQHASLGPTPTPSAAPSVTATASPAALPPGSGGPAGPTVPPVAAQAQASLAQRAQQSADAGLSFRVATFNVLGASHTTKTGDSRIKRPYTVRMNYAIQVLAAHKADVVGFQEFETPQARLFSDLVGPVWGLWPAAGGGGADGRNSIGYLKKKWELVKGTSLTIPYFNGHDFSTPVALLRDRATGRTVWFINVHNPADTRKYHHQAAYRVAAVAREMAAVKELSADGTPVVLMGDMNAKADFYCAASGAGLGLTFPNPGGVDAAGNCVGPTPVTIDWMVGTRGMAWSAYVKDRSELTRLATDHPVYSASVIVGSGQNQ